MPSTFATWISSGADTLVRAVCGECWVSSAVYQLSWKTLPGLRGLACSEFKAVPTSAPDTERGVALEFTSAAERDAFSCRLEKHFAAQWFPNAAAAFEAVKATALEWVNDPKKI